MMLNRHYYAILLAQILLTSTAAIAHNTSKNFCDDKSNTTNCSKKWEIDVTALYLKPSVSYVGIDDDIVHHRISPPTHYTWGSILSGAYHYAQDADVNMNWLYYGESNNAFVSQPVVRPPSFILSRSDSDTHYKHTLNIVNLEFGHAILFKGAQVRAHAGGQYLNYRFKHNAYAQRFVEGVLKSDQNLDISSDYNGGGPRIGIDVSHHLNSKKWSVFANGATAALLGQSKSSLFSRGISSFSHPFSSYNSIKQNEIVSELGLKVGITYETPVNHNMLSVSAGWFVTRFFNLVLSTPNSNQTTPFNLSGPFLNVKLTDDI